MGTPVIAPPQHFLPPELALARVIGAEQQVIEEEPWEIEAELLVCQTVHSARLQRQTDRNAVDLSSLGKMAFEHDVLPD